MTTLADLLRTEGAPRTGAVPKLKATPKPRRGPTPMLGNLDQQRRSRADQGAGA